MLAGSITFSEITNPHNDQRTIGIVRAEGTIEVGGRDTAWSAVLKIIDMEADAGSAAFWVHPEFEEIVYESNLFMDDGIPFRPARCYGVATANGGTTRLIWLEDLTGAKGPPFDLGELSSIAHHVGQFNGLHSQSAVTLPFEPARDSFQVRWDGVDFATRLAPLTDFSDEEAVRTAFSSTPMSVVSELVEVCDELGIRCASLERSLCFGDCQPGNLFIHDQATVAVDWASLTYDPVGVDCGVLAGSSMVWGQEGTRVAENYQRVFDGYMAGLKQRGWTGDERDVLRAFFAQFCMYLLGFATVPISLSPSGGLHSPEMLSRRLGMPVEEIPQTVKKVIDLYPSFIAEMNALI